MRLILSLMLLVGLSLPAFAVTKIGNGGAYTAAEFISRGYVIHSYLSQLPDTEKVLDTEQLNRLMDLLKTTRVEVVKEQLFDHLGAPVDARTIDDPNVPGQKMIQLNETAWDRILKSDSGVYRLIFHEYLWVLGEDDTNYCISGKVTFAPNVPSPTPTVRTCGLKGSLYERLIDCAKPTEKGGFEELATRLVPVEKSDDPLETFDLQQFYQWRLVARTVDRQQIWMDVTSGVIWTDSDISGQPYGHSGNPNAMVPAYGASDECVNHGQNIKAGLHGGPVGFKVPSTSDWSQSVKHGMLQVVPNIKGLTFWVEAPYGIQARTAIQFNDTGFTLIAPPQKSDTPLSVRCVLPVNGIN